MHTTGVVKESEILGLPPLSPLWTACVDSCQSLFGVIEFDAAFITIVCFLVCCDCLFRNERTLVFTIAARADVIALFMVLSVYVSVYRIRNLERVCVSESESECVKVRQHLRMGIKLHRLSSSIVFVEKNRRDDAKDKTADFTDARQSQPSARVRTKRSPASHQIAKEERARESYLPVITAERSRIHSLQASPHWWWCFFCILWWQFFPQKKNLKS